MRNILGIDIKNFCLVVKIYFSSANWNILICSEKRETKLLSFSRKEIPLKTIIITGASDGLGKALAGKCIDIGMQVVNLSRTPCTIQGVNNIPCDLSCENDIDKAVEIIREKFANFNVLVNNAAIVAMEKIGQITYGKFEKAWKVNAIAPLYLSSKLFDLIIRNEADILNIGTTSSQTNNRGIANQLAYTASKYGLRGGSYNIGLELSKTKCRTIHVNVGGMNTEMHKKDYGAEIEHPEEWMNPSEIAGILIYLISLPKQIEISEITIARKGRRIN